MFRQSEGTFPWDTSVATTLYFITIEIYTKDTFTQKYRYIFYIHEYK